MPNKTIEELMIRLARVEERVKNLMSWQKWQMGVLAAIFVAVFLKR